MDFLTEQRLVYTSKENENVYKFLAEKYKLAYHELFLLFSAIGFIKKERKSFNEKGREFRCNYLKPSERVSLYSILINSDEDITINDFGNKSKHQEYINVLEEYAEGGLEILIQNVFRSTYENGLLDEKYAMYISDIMHYIYELSYDEIQI